MLTTEHVEADPASPPVSRVRGVRRGTALALLLAACAALASCGGRAANDGAPSANAPSPGAPSAAAPGARAGGTNSAPSASSARLVPTDPHGILEGTRTGSKATLVNVWATWCGPCREEFPDLVRFARDYAPKGVKLMLVSADFDSTEARTFLASQGVDFESYFQTGDDMSFINGMDPRWTGSLPATFVYDAEGRRVDFWEGRADYAKFERSALAAMDGRAASPHEGDHR